MSLNYRPAPPISEIIRRLEPSLVHIRTATGSGSGFVIESYGYIITNAHVVQDHPTLTVEFVDGTAVSGLVLGRDEVIDLACIQVPSHIRLAPVTTGDSENERVGEDVVVMGYPLGEMLKGTPTVTRGIISAKRRDYLQTDAAINPGNSGGPLINSYGHVIGVNTSGIDRVGDQNITGIGFAIPINVVNERLDFLKRGGVVTQDSRAADEQGEDKWAVYHIASGGFSMVVPSIWKNHTTDDMAFFYSGPDWFIVQVFNVESEFDLDEYAAKVEGNLVEESKGWYRGRVMEMRGITLEGDFSYIIDYTGDKGERRGYIIGREILSLIESPTGTSHLRNINLEIPFGSDGDVLNRATVLLLSGFHKWDDYWSDKYVWNISAAPDWTCREYEDHFL